MTSILSAWLKFQVPKDNKAGRLGFHLAHQYNAIIALQMLQFTPKTFGTNSCTWEQIIMCDNCQTSYKWALLEYNCLSFRYPFLSQTFGVSQGKIKKSGMDRKGFISTMRNAVWLHSSFGLSRIGCNLVSLFLPSK